MSHDDFLTLAAAYAVGAVDEAERRRFDEHLAGCAECAAAVRESREALVALARDEAPVLPPPHVRDSLLRRVEGGGTRRTRGQRGWLPWAGLTAAAAAAAVVAVLIVQSAHEREVRRLDAEIVRLAAEVERERARTGEAVSLVRGLAALLARPTTRVVHLQGSGPAPGATGHVVWNLEDGGYLVVDNLPRAPEGMTYEAWTIADAPRPAGTFDVDVAGRAIHRLPASEGTQPVKVFAITLEPAGGVPAPTGPVVLASR